MASWTAIPARVGGTVMDIAETTGGLAVLAGRLVARLVPPRVDRVELVRSLHHTGVQSVAIVSVTALFVGAIMVVQAAPLVLRFDAKALVGWGAGFSTLREVGPLLIALMFNGRVGANNTAELGTMVVTDQVDALRALAIDPLSYLILPRVIAMVIMLVVLTVIGDAVAVIGSIGAAQVLIDTSPATFMSTFQGLLEPWDFFSGIIKAAIFGVMIAMTSCYFGLAVKGGAPGVGRAVNSAVVAAATGIFILDLFATFAIG